MLTDEEAKKAADGLKEYCAIKKCNKCCFERDDMECLLDYYVPSDWKLENTNG